MATKMATLQGRLGGGPLQGKVVCQFWLQGRCMRNPCRFLHQELSARTLKPPLFKKQKSRSSNGQSPGYASESSGPMDVHRKRKPKSGVKSEITGSVSASVLVPMVEDVKKRVEDVKKRPKSSFEQNSDVPMKSESSGSICTSILVPASEDRSVKKPLKTGSVAVCQDWMSAKCAKGVDCPFLHSWFSGDWFSRMVQLKGHTQAICGIGLSSVSDQLCSASVDGTMHIWNCHTGQSTRVIKLGDIIGCLISVGPWIFIGLPNCIKACNFETSAEFNLGDEHGSFGLVTAIVAGQDMLYSGTQCGSILAWKVSPDNLKPFQLAASSEGHTAAVISLAFGKERLYSGAMDCTIRVWDLHTLRCLHTLNAHSDTVMSLICWKDYLLSCSLDKTIKVWSGTEEGTLKVEYTQNIEHGAIGLGGIFDLANNPVLLCSCNDSSVHLFDLPSFDERGRIFSKQQIKTIERGPDGLFFTGDGMGMLTVWKLAACGAVSQLSK
ncbi:zinc finger CCCH domain-containing protein 48-like [Euphorbia lathyris]|uniref:zinc finger CCCH domain-containing protein 48-like n=1 Tax=Euphorbia lathyris TaxID=212925 RepID=UPI003314133A